MTSLVCRNTFSCRSHNVCVNTSDVDKDFSHKDQDKDKDLRNITSKDNNKDFNVMDKDHDFSLQSEHLYSALHGTNHSKAPRHGSHSF